MSGKEVKKFDINDLYNTLKKHDTDILKHFCDENLSDDDYFFCGINYDIISNSLNIVTNMLSDNIRSAGVDLSCRSIIESFVILKMDASGDISSTQKKIYRYFYSYVDFDNFRPILNEVGDKYDDCLNELLEDKEKATQAICEHFNCNPKDIEKKKNYFGNPCFYLKTNLKENINFSRLLKKYPIEGTNGIAMYEFFSLFIHPRCEMNPEVEDELMEFRKCCINSILNLIINFLKECKLLIFDDSSTFNADFYNNPLLRNNVNNISEINKAMNLLIGKVCELPNGYDYFSRHFLEKLKYLMIDMLLSLSLGYKEHVIAIFKSFIEEYSVFYAIGSTNNQEEFDYTKQAFYYSSRIQFCNHLDRFINEKKPILENEIRVLYNEFYKNKYQINTFEEFYNGLKKNSLYFLDNEKKNYSKYVNSLIENVFCENADREEVKILYKISLDIGHAGGYSFNASIGLIDIYSQKALLYSWKFMVHFITFSALTLFEHGINVDVKSVTDLFLLLENIQIGAINKLYEQVKVD